MNLVPVQIQSDGHVQPFQPIKLPKFPIYIPVCVWDLQYQKICWNQHAHTCTHAHVHTHTYAHTRTHTHIHTETHIYTHTYTRRYTHTYTHGETHTHMSQQDNNHHFSAPLSVLAFLNWHICVTSEVTLAHPTGYNHPSISTMVTNGVILPNRKSNPSYNHQICVSNGCRVLSWPTSVSIWLLHT